MTNKNNKDVEGPTPKKTVSKTALLFFILIFLALLILGTFYLWGEYLAGRDITPSEIKRNDNVYEQLRTSTSSDEITDIESDLRKTNFENIDEDFENIESEYE